jgi:hypothetical protein
VQVIWVNRSRVTQTNGTVLAQHGTIREQLRWLPPTPANLAKLAITIPAGYRQVHFSASSFSRGGIQYYVDG